MKSSDFVPTYKEIADVVGVDNAYKIYEHFRGQQMTFPQRIYSTAYVERYVKDNYDGTNIRELARMFNYSERRIREFLKNSI